jgi:hypothetical protein
MEIVKHYLDNPIGPGHSLKIKTWLSSKIYDWASSKGMLSTTEKEANDAITHL